MNEASNNSSSDSSIATAQPVTIELERMSSSPLPPPPLPPTASLPLPMSTFSPLASPLPPQPPIRTTSYVAVQLHDNGQYLRSQSSLAVIHDDEPARQISPTPCATDPTPTTTFMTNSPTMPSILASPASAVITTQPTYGDVALFVASEKTAYNAELPTLATLLQPERAVHLRRTNIGVLDCLCRCINYNHAFDLRSLESKRLLMTCAEHSTLACRVGCGSNRAFNAVLMSSPVDDDSGTVGTLLRRSGTPQTLATVQRESQTGTFLPCFTCVPQTAKVYDAHGSLLGTLTSDSLDCISPCIRICDDEGRQVVVTKGPCCIPHIFCYWCQQTFDILDTQQSTNSGTLVGSIVKQMSGFWRELCTDADNYEINFPPTASVGMKVLLIMATFYIDMRYFDIGGVY